MVELNAIRRYLLKVAREAFGPKRVADVRVVPYTPVEGEAGLSATIVLRASEGYKLSLEQLRTITRRANDFMQAADDKRFIYTRYATLNDVKELAQLDD